jgi:hypothetical protein
VKIQRWGFVRIFLSAMHEGKDGDEEDGGDEGRVAEDACLVREEELEKIEEDRKYRTLR